MAKRGKAAKTPKKKAVVVSGRKRGRPKGKDGYPKPLKRVTVFGKGGNRPEAPHVIAPEPEVLNLGPLVVPEGEDATRALRELGVLNDRVLAAHQAMKDAQAVAKTRREKWNELSEALQKKIRRFTHPSDLPLFDTAEREADQQRMELAASEMVPPPLPEPAQSPPEATPFVVETLQVGYTSDAPTEALSEADIPF